MFVRLKVKKLEKLHEVRLGAVRRKHKLELQNLWRESGAGGSSSPARSGEAAEAAADAAWERMVVAVTDTSLQQKSLRKAFEDVTGLLREYEKQVCEMADWMHVST